jgi:hypothetical protein
MNIFISWSGKLSHEIALILKEYLPLIINQVEPFVSSEDIKKGNNWNSEISGKLKDTDFGILCLTKENLTSPWLLFEAGALSKNIEKSKVCGVLFDNLKQNEIETPLSLFQSTKFEKDDFGKLIQSVNDSLASTGLSNELLTKSFEKWWPELEEKVTKVTKEHFPQKPQIKKEDTLNEILNTTKFISKVVSRFNYNLPTDSLDFARYDDETEPITFTGLLNNHPVKLIVSPVYKANGDTCKIEITKKGVKELEPEVHPRGVFIELVFYSEEGEFWSIYFHFHKGDTYISTQKVDIGENEASELEHNPIWRD